MIKAVKYQGKPRKIPGNQGKSLKYVGLEDYVMFKMVSFQGTLIILLFISGGKEDFCKMVGNYYILNVGIFVFCASGI